MDIEHWRKEIDEVDGELLRLLNIRARLATKVGSIKRATGLPLRDLDREQFVLDRLQEANSGPLDQEAVVRLFRRIMRESRRAEALASQQSNGSNLASASNPTKLRGIA
jgi:chorismate mutase